MILVFLHCRSGASLSNPLHGKIGPLSVGNPKNSTLLLVWVTSMIGLFSDTAHQKLRLDQSMTHIN